MLSFPPIHEAASLLFRGQSRVVIRTVLDRELAWLLLGGLALGSPLQPVAAAEPRIVNIYNFIRNSDFRLQNSEEVVLHC